VGQIEFAGMHYRSDIGSFGFDEGQG
jgi:hypothetical protein